jgi:hypothetical protein
MEHIEMFTYEMYNVLGRECFADYNSRTSLWRI